MRKSRSKRNRHVHSRHGIALDSGSVRISIVKQEALSLWNLYQSYLSKTHGYQSVQEMISGEIAFADRINHGNGDFSYEEMRQSMIGLQVIASRCLDGVLRQRKIRVFLFGTLMITLLIAVFFYSSTERVTGTIALASPITSQSL